MAENTHCKLPTGMVMLNNEMRSLLGRRCLALVQSWNQRCITRDACVTTRRSILSRPEWNIAGGYWVCEWPTLERFLNVTSCDIDENENSFSVVSSSFVPSPMVAQDWIENTARQVYFSNHSIRKVNIIENQFSQRNWSNTILHSEIEPGSIEQ